MSGLFVVFEGLTGSGKKTHINLLAEKLKEIGKEVTLISFPNYETEIARLTKRVTFDPYTLSLLYAADRSQYQGRIKSLIEAGNVIISDRYCYSNFTYQSTKGVPLEWLMELERNTVKPDIVFLIDVPIETGMKRVQQANIEDFTKMEILDRLHAERELLEKIRENYLYLSRTDKESKWYVIDGTKSIDEIHNIIWSAVEEELKK